VGKGILSHGIPSRNKFPIEKGERLPSAERPSLTEGTVASDNEKGGKPPSAKALLRTLSYRRGCSIRRKKEDRPASLAEANGHLYLSSKGSCYLQHWRRRKMKAHPF